MTILPTPQPLDLHATYAAQHQASRQHTAVPLSVRLDRLARLQTLIDDHEKELTDAVHADFGMRSALLTTVADLFVLRAGLADLRRHTGRWMKPQKVSTPIYLQPARARIERQPLGVVGIIGPWNYPIQLTLGPMAAALAAGNRVMLKPSEFTPQTSAALARCVAQYFAPDEAAVFTGGPDLAAEFASLPFDHLFFTGSTAVGRKVAEAAARNLTPVTLELGGKSPCIIDASCTDLGAAALKIAHGKLLNAGQTCIAPDYMLLPKGREAEFADAYRTAVARLFPTIAGNPDYAAIVTERHQARLHALLDEARAAGAQVLDMAPGVPPAAEGASGTPAAPAENAAPANAAPASVAPVSVVPGNASAGNSASENAASETAAPATPANAAAPAAPRQMRPVLVTGTQPSLRLMQEEIFGPILPVLSYDSLQQAIEHINARPRPLALYWFGSDTAARDTVLAGTVSGGVTVNDTLLHVAHENLPFGGVGDSGIGAYHGITGFLRLSHQKAVYVQSPLAMSHLFYPPYGATLQKLMAVLRKLF